MTSRRALLTALAAAASGGAVWALPSATEQARIERLIQYVETHPSAKFVRNGKVHSGADAGRFLRGKMAKMGEHVTTAQDFINQIASVSSTTGQAYAIRLMGGAEVPAAQFLNEELKRMDR